jgi:hypothetical protein
METGRDWKYFRLDWSVTPRLTSGPQNRTKQGRPSAACTEMTANGMSRIINVKAQITDLRFILPPFQKWRIQTCINRPMREE